MPSPKQERANATITKVLEDDKDRGTIDPRSALPGRMVGDPNGLEARIILDHRFNVAPAYGKERTERRPIPDKSWRAVSVWYRGTEVLAVNVRGSYFHIAYYKPGPWERSFGVDWEGDHVIHQWGDPPIGDDIEEQLRLREKDLQLEPTRGHPPEVDELRNLAMRPGRFRRPEPRPDGPYSLSVRG